MATIEETPGALRFIERDERDEREGDNMVRRRILQQRWMVKTWGHDTSGHVKTEWRDVPLVRDENEAN